MGLQVGVILFTKAANKKALPFFKAGRVAVLF